MRRVYRYLKSTVIGGLVVLVPLVVVAAIAVWAVGTAIAAVRPLISRLPDTSVGGVSLALLAAIVGLLGVCLLAGMFAEATIIRRLTERAERFALAVPGYALMKSVGANLVGVEGKYAVKTVLVRFEATWQLGFLMESLADGRHVVFIPGVPGALVGTLHVVAADRVEMLQMSVREALEALGRLGVGFREAQAV
jgi:uncharacterized membrane protein